MMPPDSSDTPTKSSIRPVTGLTPAAYNPRKPWTNSQREQFLKSLHEFGDLSGIIENQRTGCLIGGHKRTEAFKNDPDARVVITERLATPDAVGTLAYGYIECAGTRWSYRLVDWDKKKEAAANIAANKWSAAWDVEAETFLARNLVDQGIDMSMLGYSDNELSKLLDGSDVQLTPEDLATDSHIEVESDISPEKSPVYALREDAIFESNLKYNIPPLRSDMLADVPLPERCWLGEKEWTGLALVVHGFGRWPKDTSKCVLTFTTWDYKIECIWYDAVRFVEKLKAAQFAAVIAPDFSMWRDDPLAVQIWNLYRSAWVARYWQECGIRIIPLLNWSDDRTLEFCFDHIPRKPPIVMCQCRTQSSFIDWKWFCKGLQTAVDTLEPKSVWIYGDPKSKKLLESRFLGNTFKWLESRTVALRKQLQSKGTHANNR